MKASSDQLQLKVSDLERRVSWRMRQIFGQKSERRSLEFNARQPTLGEWIQGDEPIAAEITVAEHHRSQPAKDVADEDESGLPFDALGAPPAA